MVSIYACDQQVIRCLIVPTDNQVRADLPVTIKSGNTTLATTATDSNGMITASYYYPSIDAYHPVIHCGNNTQEVYDTDVQVIPCSLTVQSDKSMLSCSDDDSALITALLTEDINDTPLSGREVSFVFKKASDDSVIETKTDTTNNMGEASVTYSSNELGDIYVEITCGTVQADKILEIQVGILDLEANVRGIYNSNLKNITISGNILIDNQAVEKPVQIYRYNNNNWEYLNTVTSNSQGEFSLIDKGAVYLKDDTVAGTRNELQTLINNAIANNESEVVLEKKYVFSENDAPVLITEPIQIKGNNHIIDANNYSQIFTVTGNDVTITDLILINAYANGNGGAVNWSGENGVLSSILFANCECTNNGGAVYWTGNHGTVQNCRAVNNRTGGNGTFYAEVDNFTITNHDSFGNHSEGEGGCMDIRGNYAHIESINTSKDRSGGGKACINVRGDNSNIHHINMDSLVFGGSYVNRSYVSNNSFKYKVQPAPSWVENYEDFALERLYTPVHGINISSDKDVLSYVDNDVATLTAQLVDSNNESISFNGLPVTFEVRKVSDDNLVETLSGVTDGSSLATVSYASKDTGDIYITAVCQGITSTQTYIQDVYFSYADEITETQTNTSNTYHQKIMLNKSLLLPSDFEFSCKIKTTMYNNSRFGLCPVSSFSEDGTNNEGFVSCQQTNTEANGLFRKNGTNSGIGSTKRIDGTVWHDWKMIQQGNIFKWFVDDVQVGSDTTLSWFDTTVDYTFLLSYWQNGTFTVKEIKIKEL